MRLTVANASNFLVRKDRVFFVVDKATCLFNQCWWETERKTLVVNELRVDIVVHLWHMGSDQR